jgi:transcriptional regulator with XRE-family HTH domain
MVRDRSDGRNIGVRFGDRIRSLREKRGWTLTYLSAHSGLSKTFLTNLETAKKEPCLLTIETLAHSFDLTVGKLMRGL